MTHPALQPLDEHNRKLQAAVHPTDWQNPKTQGRYNVVVIGAGTAGLVTAAGAVGMGAKVALIERGLMGGDCLNVGCVPSKAIIHSANSGTSFNQAMQRMRKLRADIANHDSARRFTELGVDVFLGDARFERDGIVSVAGMELSYARAVIATGGRAAVPDVAGLAEAGYLTNETIFSLTALPQRLAVIGGGPIGCELAQAFAKFGSKVTLIQSADRLLPREDPEAAALVTQALQRDSVEIHCSTRPQAVTRQDDERIITVTSQDETHQVTCDQILISAGRTANVEDLNLKAVGVAYDAAGVTVNEQLRTSNRRIFAAGDVCSRFKFTHAADAMARLVIQNALFFGRTKASTLTIPWCTYTQPELAHIGLSEQAAAQENINIDTFRIDMAEVDRAILDGQTEGFLKVHVKQGSDQIVGATLVATHAGDMIGELSLAMTCNIGLGKIASTIHPYPTQAEVIKKAADAYNRTRLTPGIKRWFERLLAWRR